MTRKVWPLTWIGFLVSLPAAADLQVNMTPGITEVSHEVYHLHMIIFWICVAIGIVVFGVMLWSIIYHRKSRGAEAHHFHEHTAIEILWTIIPFAILVAMAVPATATLIKMYDTSKADLDIRITGYQWKWRYHYVGHDVDYFSVLTTPQEQIHNQQAKDVHYLREVDKPLVLPAGKKVRFLLTSNDVIHSWWVPALAVKKDAIPGYINEAWAKPEEPGTYRGQCAELCGQGHAFMPIVVEVKPPAEFDKWLADQQSAASAEAAAATREWSHDELMKQGEKVFLKICAACHQANGQGIPGAFPALAGSPITTGDVNTHIHVVLNGRPGTAMQAFGKQLSAVDLASVITYERNAWGNNTGDTVTPQQISKQLQQ